MRLIFPDKTITDHDITNGGIELKTKPNYSISFDRDGSPSTVRWTGLGLSVRIKDLTATPKNMRIIIIVLEQVRGNTGGQESVVHCSTLEY